MSRLGTLAGITLAIVLACATPSPAAPGSLLWADEFGPPSGYLTGTRVAIAPHGDVYVAALNHVGSSGQFAVARYTPAGDQRWFDSYQPPAPTASMAAMAVDGKGGLVVVGKAEMDAPHQYAFIARWAADGTQQYAQPLAVGAAADVVCDGAGNAYVVGWTGEAPTTSWLVAKYDPYGNQVWSRSYDGPEPEGTDMARAVARGPDGSIYVAGQGGGPTIWSRVVVRKYSAGGALKWSRTWNKAPAAVSNVISDIAVKGARLALCGSVLDDRSHWHPLALSYTTGGTLKWARFHDYTTTQTGAFAAVAVDANGNVVATGQRDLSGTGDWGEQDLLAVRYKAGGSRAWERVHMTGGYPDTGTAVEFDASGNAFVVGASSWLATGPERDALCWSIAPGGDTRWSKIYSHLGYAAATDVAVTSRAVYVAGEHGSGGLLLLKYGR